MSKRYKAGIGLIEVVIGAALVLLIFSGIVSVFNFYLKGAVSLTDNIKANLLADEGVEAVRAIRTIDWNYLASLEKSVPHYLYLEEVWKPTSTPEIVDGIYQRSFVLSEVERDGAGNIGSGIVDPNTLLVEVNVNWTSERGNEEAKLSSYITNVFEF